MRSFADAAPGRGGRYSSSPMPIRTRRWNDPREPGDGFRLLICRYRPRALPKALETWDAWAPMLGPSRQLHADFYGKQRPPIDWPEYRARYLAEMEAQRPRIEELAARAKSGETVTLLCSKACDDERHCHRKLLRDLIEEVVAR
jgi:uncharacterized protein YeaO (DUF488 family)